MSNSEVPQPSVLPTRPESDAALAFRSVSKTYDTFATGTKYALRDVSFDVAAGGIIAVVGRSGSGKSTLLDLAAGIDSPSSGAVLWDGRDIGALPDRERTLRRRDHIGFVFQFFHLLSHLTVCENVAVPELIAGGAPADYRDRIGGLLARVGLDDRADDPVDRLSGGEMQRVAICRALLRRPQLLLADEPTGNLDDATGRAIMDLMLDLVKAEGGTLIYVTHSRELAARADAVWEIHSGRLEV
ncbi:MAG: ABC transporter ATP-binding protein [Gemmatimonadales bacterium]|nr:ABC transporter ATP-binding protein [Gemmatimonadales bacterium]